MGVIRATTYVTRPVLSLGPDPQVVSRALRGLPFLGDQLVTARRGRIEGMEAEELVE